MFQTLVGLLTDVKKDVGEVKGSLVQLTKRVDSMEVRMDTMDKKLDGLDGRMVALERQLGRVFERTARAIVEKRYGEPFARPFLACGADGLVRLSCEKRHGKGGKDESCHHEERLRLLAQGIVFKLVYSIGDDGSRRCLTADILRDTVKPWNFTGVAAALDQLHDLPASDAAAAAAALVPILRNLDGVAVLLACWFAFGEARSAPFRQPGSKRFGRTEYSLPSLYSQLELDCRGSVKVYGQRLEIRMAEIKASGHPAYGIHQVAMCLLVRAFVALLVHPGIRSITLHGMVFVERNDGGEGLNPEDIVQPLLQLAQPVFGEVDTSLDVEVVPV